jgi:hypothetical protein
MLALLRNSARRDGALISHSIVTLSNFEAGKTPPYRGTLLLKQCLEATGVEFIAENGGGAGGEAEEGLRMTARHPVEVERQYRTAGAPGSFLPIAWEVLAVYVPWLGGFEDARLRSVDVRAEMMILADSVVADKARFTRID